MSARWRMLCSEARVHAAAPARLVCKIGLESLINLGWRLQRKTGVYLRDPVFKKIKSAVYLAIDWM